MMPQGSESAIADEFIIQLHRFDTFLDELTQKWPGDNAIINRCLDRHIHDIDEIAHQRKEATCLTEDSEFFHGVLALESAESPEITEHENFSFFQEPFDTFPSSLSPSGAEASESVHAPLYGNSTVAGTLPDVDRHDPFAEQRNEDNTIDPMTLSLDSGGSHNEVVQRTGPCQSTVRLSSCLTMQQSSVKIGKQVSPSAGSRKRARSKGPVRKSGSKRAKPHRILPYFPGSEDEVRNHLDQSLEKEDKDCAKIIGDVYFATASAESMVQLKDVITVMRQPNRSWTRSPVCSSFVTLWSALNQLDAMQHAMAFLRRILLLRMAHHRDRRSEEVRDQMQSAQKTRQSLAAGKAESTVLDELIQEIHPHTTIDFEEMDTKEWRKKYHSERKRLRNRLFAAKNWQRAVDMFGFGILALIPTGGAFRIQNQGFETLRDKPCEVLLSLLQEKESGYINEAAARLTPFVQAVYDGGDYLSKIGVEILNDPSSEPMDSVRIVALCNVLPESEQDNG